MTDFLISSSSTKTIMQPWCDPEETAYHYPSALLYNHPRLQTLPSEALLSLSGYEGQLVIQRRDADKQEERELLPIHPNTPLLGSDRLPPPLKWQREALCHYLTACIQARYGEGVSVEIFYSGGRALKLALGEEGYPKLCDTDIKLFLSGAPVEALDHVARLVDGFIRHLFCEYHPNLGSQLPSEWISRYMPKGGGKLIIDPGKGIYRASVTIGSEEDWLVILDQDKGRLHSVTGKALLISMDTPVMVSLEGSVEDALYCARQGIIKTDTPHELEGNASLSELELMTHGWAYPKTDPLLSQSFTACIVKRCQASPWLWSTYCKSHRSGWDHIGSVTFLLAGFFQIVADPHATAEDKAALLSQIGNHIEKYLRISKAHGRALVKEASPFLAAVADAIITHRDEYNLIAAEVMFLMTLYPHAPHRLQRCAVEDEKAYLSSHEGVAFLLVPRRSLSFPDRCYLPVPKDLSVAWHLISLSRDCIRGEKIWAHCTSPLTIEGIQTMCGLLAEKNYSGLMRYLIGELWDSRGFFALFPMPEKAHIATKTAIITLEESFSKSGPAKEGIGGTYIELKLITLKVLLSNVKSLRVVVEQLTRLLGTGFLWGAEEKRSVLKVVNYLLTSLAKGGWEVPDFSQFKGDHSPVDYITDYYTACDSCENTRHLPPIHYRALADDRPELFCTLSHTVLVEIYQTQNTALFEALWRAVPLTNSVAFSQQCENQGLLATFIPYILEVDSSTSQLYKLSDAWLGSVDKMNAEEAKSVLNRLLTYLLKEKLYDHYVYARNLYKAANDRKLLVLSDRITLFKKMARYFFNHERNDESMTWMSQSLADIYKRGKYSLLKGDKVLCNLTESVFRRWGGDALAFLWTTPSLFLALANHGKQDLVLKMYQDSLTREAFDNAVEANMTYALVKGLLSGPLKEDYALAFSLWRSGLYVAHPNKSYREKVAALFLLWADKTGVIPIEWQRSLCETLDGFLPPIDLYKIVMHFLSQESIADEVWPFLSQWLLSTHRSRSTPKSEEGSDPTKKRFLLAVGNKLAKGLSLADRCEWLSIACEDKYSIDATVLTSWVIDVVSAVLKVADRVEASELSTLLSHIEKSLLQARDQAVFTIDTLEPEYIYLLFEIYPHMLKLGWESAVERFLDDCDVSCSFECSKVLQGLRKMMRRSWVAVLTSPKTMNSKKVGVIKKQINTLRNHPDLTIVEVSQLYQSPITYLRQQPPSKNRVQQMAAFFKGMLEEGSLRLDGKLVQQDLSVFFQHVISLNTVASGKIGWELITHPRVAQLLAKTYVAERACFIRWYVLLSQSVAEEVFQFFSSRWDDRAFFKDHIPLYKTLITCAAAMSDHFYFVSLKWKIYQQADKHNITISYNKFSHQVAIVEGYCSTAKDIYEKKWPQQQLQEAESMLSSLLSQDERDLLSQQENRLLALVAGLSGRFLLQCEDSINRTLAPSQAKERALKVRVLTKDVIKVLCHTGNLPLILKAITLFRDRIIKSPEASHGNEEYLPPLEDILEAFNKIIPLFIENKREQFYQLTSLVFYAFLTSFYASIQGGVEAPTSLVLAGLKTLDNLIETACPGRVFQNACCSDYTLALLQKAQQPESSPWHLSDSVAGILKKILHNSGGWFLYRDLCTKIWHRLLQLYWEMPFSSPTHSREDQVVALLSQGCRIFHDGFFQLRDPASLLIDPATLNPLCNAVKRQMTLNPNIKGGELSSSLLPLRGTKHLSIDNLRDWAKVTSTKDSNLVNALQHASDIKASLPQSIARLVLKRAQGESSPPRSLAAEWVLFSTIIKNSLPKNKLTPEMTEVLLLCADWIIAQPEDDHESFLLLSVQVCALKASKNRKRDNKVLSENLKSAMTFLRSTDGSLERGFNLLRRLIDSASSRMAIIEEDYKIETIRMCSGLLYCIWDCAYKIRDQESLLEKCQAITEELMDMLTALKRSRLLNAEQLTEAVYSIDDAIKASPWVEKKNPAYHWYCRMQKRLYHVPVENMITNINDVMESIGELKNILKNIMRPDHDFQP